MYTYNQFKTLMAQKIGAYLETEDRSILSVDLFSKERNNNQQVDSLNIKMKYRDELQNMTPTIDIAPIYSMYRANGGDFEATMNAVVADFSAKLDRMPAWDTKKIDSVPYILENCFIRLVNRSTNENIIENCPHTEFHDLEMVYRVLVSQEADNMASYLVTNDVLEKTGISQEVLHEAAYKNTREMLPIRAEKLTDIVRNNMISNGMDEEMVKEMIPDGDQIVLTNEKFIYGATSMIYPDVLQKLAEEYDSSFVVMPSSVNQVILTPMADNAAMREIYVLSEMVEDVNRTTVNIEDQLSNEVYFYNKNTRTLLPVADAPELKETIAQEKMFKDASQRGKNI